MKTEQEIREELESNQDQGMTAKFSPLIDMEGLGWIKGYIEALKWALEVE